MIQRPKFKKERKQDLLELAISFLTNLRLMSCDGPAKSIQLETLLDAGAGANSSRPGGMKMWLNSCEQIADGHSGRMKYVRSLRRSRCDLLLLQGMDPYDGKHPGL